MSNFGYIKDTFNKILSDSLLTKNEEGKNLFKKYIQTLKEDVNLKNEYLIFKNLTTKKFKNNSDAKDYIKENINILKNTDNTKGIKKLINILGDNKLVKEDKEIYNHINILRNTKKTPSTIETIQESINYIKEKMLEDKIVETTNYDTVGIPPSVLTKLAVDRFNLKFKDINESEKEIIKTILNGNEEEKENIYKTLKNECIDIIDNRLDENSDIDIKDKLLKVKDKLLRMSYSKDSFEKDIDDVYNLKNSVVE